MEIDKETVDVLKNLISSVQGAPFPKQIEDELYTIWYEHMQETLTTALTLMNKNGIKLVDDTNYPDDF